MSSRARVVGSTVAVTLAVWAAFSSADYAMTRFSFASISAVALVAFAIGTLGTTRRVLSRGPLAMAVMLSVSCAPWLVATAFSPLDKPAFDYAAFAPNDVLSLEWLFVLAGRAEGAALSAALLCAEALTLTRLSSQTPPRRPLLGLLIAAPIQLAWWHLFANTDAMHDRPLVAWIIVPLVSAALIPLSLWRGAQRTVDVVAVLTLASWAAMAVLAGQLTESLGGYHPDTPASRASITASFFLDDYPTRWLELVPWGSLLSLVISIVALKPTRALAAAAVVAALVLLLDGTALINRRRELPNVEHLPSRECAVIEVPGFATQSLAEQVFNQRSDDCVLVYGRAQFNADANSFNALDHVRAISAIEPILWPR